MGMNDPKQNPQGTEHLRDHLFSARLEAAEARMHARVVTNEERHAALMLRLDERFANIDVRFDSIDKRFDSIDKRFDSVDARISKVEATVSGLRTTIIVTGIASVIGIATLNATMQSNMIAAFESGRTVTEAQAKISRQAEETDKLLKQIQQRLLVPPAK